MSHDDTNSEMFEQEAVSFIHKLHLKLHLVLESTLCVQQHIQTLFVITLFIRSNNTSLSWENPIKNVQKAQIDILIIQSF